ncbi:MAG: hypothetical protein WBA41_26625, partial [Rivularia sp. (in: cyanobacteria)]
NQSDIDAILQAGWDKQAIEDAICVCSLFNFMNRFVSGYGLQAPNQKQLAEMVEGVNTYGYEKPLSHSN